MTDATLPDSELIARLRARKGFGRFPGDATWFQLDQPDKDCTVAADALANQDEYIAEAYREGYREGQGDASGACAELWSLVFRWADKRDLIGEPDEPEGFTAHQLFEAITEHEKELTDALAKADERIAELERKVYKPGVWRCAKCNFQLVQSSLNANTGAVTARDDPGTKCPNDESPMWRVSYQEDNAKAWKWGEEQFDLRQAAEACATALEARVKVLEEALTPSEFTKVAYQGHFEFSVSGRSYIVPWITIKQIMAEILGRAGLAQSGEG